MRQEDAELTPWEIKRALWARICPESRDAENICGVSAFWWTWLLVTIPHFFATNTLFVGLQNRGNEHQWAVGTGIAAMTWLISRSTPHPLLRFLSATASLGAFAFIAASIKESSPLLWKTIPVTTGFGVYAALAAFSFKAMVRLGSLLVTDMLRRYAQKKQKVDITNDDQQSGVAGVA